MNFPSIPAGLPSWLTLGFLIVIALIALVRMLPSFIREMRGLKADALEAEQARSRLEGRIEIRRKEDVLDALARAQADRDRVDNMYEQLFDEKAKNAKFFDENMRLTRENQRLYEENGSIKAEHARLSYQIELFAEFMASDRASEFTKSAWNRINNARQRAEGRANADMRALPGSRGVIDVPFDTGD